jgi:hypothetical protein
LVRSHALPPAAPVVVVVVASLIALVAGCGADPEDPPATPDPETVAAAPVSAQDAWWARLSEPCGEAFPGRLGHAPPGDDMLQGEELLVVHFDVCGEDEIRLPFHIENLDGSWDRSRTWIFRRTDDGRIELRHDHRQPDGTEDEQTWYGAWTVGEGTPSEQRFLIEDRTYPDGLVRGWRVIIEPGVGYTYGTIRGDDWSWRVDFNLSVPLDAPPPPAWGYEDGAGPPR